MIEIATVHDSELQVVAAPNLLHTYEDHVHIPDGKNFLGFLAVLKGLQEMRTNGALARSWVHEFEQSIFNGGLEDAAQRTFEVYDVMASFIGGRKREIENLMLGTFIPHGVYGRNDDVYGEFFVADDGIETRNLESHVGTPGFEIAESEFYPARISRRDGIFVSQIIIPNSEYFYAGEYSEDFNKLAQDDGLYSKSPVATFNRLYAASVVNPALPAHAPIANA